MILLGGCARRASAEAHAETMYPSRSREFQAFQATLDLFETGVDVMRQNLRRRHPAAAPEDIERLLQEWMRERPGAESGDCPGRAVDVNSRLA